MKKLGRILFNGVMILLCTFVILVVITIVNIQQERNTLSENLTQSLTQKSSQLETKDSGQSESDIKLFVQQETEKIDNKQIITQFVARVIDKKENKVLLEISEFLIKNTKTLETNNYYWLDSTNLVINQLNQTEQTETSVGDTLILTFIQPIDVNKNNEISTKTLVDTQYLTNK